MKAQLEQVLEFHRAFGCHVETTPTGDLPKSQSDIRAKLMQEELEEYRKAVTENDLVQIADALSDMMYVLLGTYIAHGLHDRAEQLFDEVHRSNMDKLGADGKPILRADGKVLKPDDWSPPNIAEILQSADHTAE